MKHGASGDLYREFQSMCLVARHQLVSVRSSQNQGYNWDRAGLLSIRQELKSSKRFVGGVRGIFSIHRTGRN